MSSTAREHSVREEQSLSQLLAADAEDRIDAIDSIDLKASPHNGACFAVRELLLSDENAHVRAAAAAFFEHVGSLRGLPIMPALIDTLHDTHPSVRHAACRALARSGSLSMPGNPRSALSRKHAVSTLRRLAIEEPIWWVRRAAVLSLARIDREAAIPTLRLVLDDPFWRVRHAAVRAMIALSKRDLDQETRKKLLEASNDDAQSERAQGALAYLARRIGNESATLLSPLVGTITQSPDATTASPHAGALADPDPAVIAARIENGLDATPAELALYLGDPHERLRRAAADRLAELPRDVSTTTRAFLAASLWLEEPRIPHATASVVKLLDSLGGSLLAEELLDAASSPNALVERPGLVLWALSFIAMSGGWDRRDFVVSALDAESALVKRGAIAALASYLASGEGAHDERTPALIEKLAQLMSISAGAAAGTYDEDVHRLAVHALVQSQLPEALRAVLGLSLENEPPAVRRLIVLAARFTENVGVLRIASQDVDPETRAQSLATLHSLGLLDEAELAKARADEDPWIRGAVLDQASACHALKTDVDPSLKRAAFDAASGSSQFEASRIAMTDDDSYLRAVAAEQLARSDEDEDLVRVLRLSRDPDLAVRAAAANVLETRDLEARLSRVRESTDEQLVRDAADTWLGTRAEALIAAEIAMLRAAGTPVVVEKTTPKKKPAQIEIANARPLGQRSGLVISPLVMSGAYEPSVPSLFRAMNNGCNAFFWEPRYRNLTTFLKAANEREQRPLVIAGTYHATERAIRDDVALALRRLRRKQLDVLLVFWVRSSERLTGEVPRVLADLKREGLVRAVGFSTHDRALALEHLASPFDVIMIRHSAAHPGAEEQLFSRAHEAGMGVLGFSATSYTRLMRLGEKEKAPTAAECYRYSLSQHGVTACVSAPRGGRELIENLSVLTEPTLSQARIEEMRERGKTIRAESRDFNQFIRRFPTLPDQIDHDITNALLDSELDGQLGLPHG